jgi:mRNA-degrading endonuclease toxin of MazEF toxin-antitoxin module
MAVIPSAGDIFLADTRDERRRRVLVVSDTRFHRATDRVMIAPSIATITADESPWRPGLEERFAVDFLTTLPLERLLEAVGRVDAATLRRAQRAVVMSL